MLIFTFFVLFLGLFVFFCVQTNQIWIIFKQIYLTHSVAYIYILDTYRRSDNRHSNKGRRKENAMTKMQEGWTQEDFFTNIHLSILLQGFERVVQGLHVRGCWRPNINFIFWPHCYDRHVVSCSPDVGVHSIGGFQGTPQSGVAFPTTSRL